MVGGAGVWWEGQECGKRGRSVMGGEVCGGRGRSVVGGAGV